MLHTNLIRDIKKYKRIKNLSKKEKREIKKIKNIFDEYLYYIVEIQEHKNQNFNIIDVNNLVQINDLEALLAIKNLSKNIYGKN